MKTELDFNEKNETPITLNVNTLSFLGTQINQYVKFFSIISHNVRNPYCHLKPIQLLFNYARAATLCITSFKKRFVEADLAYYDNDGKFTFRDKIAEIEENEAETVETP